eukprot:Phypoly_transcript_05638.p1 GENE.Phypoly_transcript_05638~~Phypoly_transcript_05638.p1  ORF type:complete len:569 (+),score=96.82 Phypoly_transcript_05638:196-1902(+)
MFFRTIFKKRSAQGEPVDHIWNLIIKCCYGILTPLELLFLSSVNLGFRSTIAPFIRTTISFRIPRNVAGSAIGSTPRLVLVHSPRSIPVSATHVTFCDHFSKPIQTLPTSITHLCFGATFNSEVTSLPPSLHYLNCGLLFNLPLPTLPPTLTHLVTGMSFNQPLLELPQSITHLSLSFSYRSKINFPPLLSHLACGGRVFTHENTKKALQLVHLIVDLSLLDILPQFPSSLARVELPRYHPSLDCLPSSVKCLHYPFCPDPPLSYPPALTHLTFGVRFNHPVNNLPSSLTYLAFQCEHLYEMNAHNCFSHPVDALPPSLATLSLNMCYAQNIDHLPPSLTRLSLAANIAFNHPVDLLPPSITFLDLGKEFNQPLLSLPLSLIHLTIQGEFSHPFPPLPSLTHLTLESNSFSHPLTHLTSLTHLHCELSDYSWDLLPPSLSHITMKKSCMLSSSLCTTPTLTHLSFDPRIIYSEHPLSSLPSALTHLTFGRYSTYPLPPLPPLPSTLTHLMLGIRFSHALPPLPPALCVLEISKKYPAANLQKIPKTVLVRRYGKLNAFLVDPFDPELY